jgi:hypothetical protein
VKVVGVKQAIKFALMHTGIAPSRPSRLLIKVHQLQEERRAISSLTYLFKNGLEDRNPDEWGNHGEERGRFLKQTTHNVVCRH